MPLASRLPPLKLPQGTTLHDYFFAETAKYAEAKAMVNYNTKESLTFAEMREKAKEVAAALVCLGIEKGEVVLVALDNRPETVYIILGISMAGAIASTVSPVCSSDEISHQMESSFTRFVFAIPRGLPAVQEIFHRLRRENRIIVVGARDDAKGLPILSDLALAVDDLEAVSFPALTPEEDVAYLPFSSGVHGDKKGILMTHAVMCNQLAIANHPFYDNPRMGDVTVSLLPYSRHLGLECCLISLLNGATVVAVYELDIRVIMEAIDAYEARVIFASPYGIHLMSHSATSGNNNNSPVPTLASLKTVIVGTGPLTEKAHTLFVTRFPDVALVSMYGMTETGVISRSSTTRKYTKNTGTLASSLQLKVLDLSTGEELKRGEHGIIYVAGPSTSAPYLDAPELDPMGGWRKTGDIGYVDSEDNVHLIDRAKEMIKVFGYQVIPKEIEEILHSHPAVVDCAVVGVKDAEAGERPVAFAVLKPLDMTSKEELLDFVNDRLVHQKHLYRVEMAQTLPRTSCGAILRRVLSEISLPLG